jgi:hypothetical protein
MKTTAREILSSKFVRIGEGHSTAEAIGIIFNPESSTLREIVIIVLDGEGNYAGMVEPRNILESLGTELSAAGEDPAAQVAAIRRGLNVPVSDIARRDIPAARLDDNLATLLGLAARTDASTLPVFQDQVFTGIVPVTALFDAICKKTLSSEGDDLPFMGGSKTP